MPSKPLNIVVDTFSDEEEGTFYVKDNQKNIIPYSLHLVEEIRGENLKTKIQAFSEDELINVVLVPILCAQGFKGVKPISFHGPGESGGDFHPFYKPDEFGKIVYYSAS